MDISAIIGIAGTILGFALGEVAARIRDARQNKRQVQAVRAILRLEMQHNLQLLRELWQRVSPEGRPAGDDSTRRARAYELVGASMPAFQRDAIQSQLPLVSIALSESEIATVFSFYERYARLAAIRAYLTELLAEQKASLKLAAAPTPENPGAPLVSAPFYSRGPELYEEAEQIVQAVLTAGNPLTA